MSKLPLALACDIIAGHLDKIEKCFKPGVKMTILVRRPGEPEQDFVMSNDTAEGIVGILDRSLSRTPHVTPALRDEEQ